jgi:nitrite reductase/ring-hydroxylating ferredoxin subunit/uncharacterized membrane protein
VWIAARIGYSVCHAPVEGFIVPSIRTTANRAITTIEGRRWLDKPGYTLEHLLAQGFNLLGARGRALQNVLHGNWLGHPIHPALTDIPLGAWTAAVILDGIDAAVTKPAGFRQAAQAAVGIGIVGGLGAAVTGATDWQYTHDTARRVGLVHGVVNTAALGAYSMSWRDRRDGRFGRARALGVVGYVLAVSAGHLGGELVFRHRIGVDRSEPSLEPREFVPVIAASALEPDTPHRIDHAGVKVVLIRRGERIFAVGEQCSHLSAPMSQGWLYRGELVCPWHGSHFDMDSGAPANGPATAPLACYETREAGGQIEIRRRPPVSAPTRGPRFATAVVSR